MHVNINNVLVSHPPVVVSSKRSFYLNFLFSYFVFFRKSVDTKSHLWLSVWTSYAGGVCVCVCVCGGGGGYVPPFPQNVSRVPLFPKSISSI